MAVDATTSTPSRPITAQIYAENVFNDQSVTYIHPEAFLASRFGTLRPRTIGIRLGYGI